MSNSMGKNKYMFDKLFAQMIIESMNQASINLIDHNITFSDDGGLSGAVRGITVG